MHTIEQIKNSYLNRFEQVQINSLYDANTIALSKALNLSRLDVNVLKLLSLTQDYQLRKILRLNYYELEKLVNQPKYIEFSIPKKRGGFRKIYSPEKKLKSAQKRLNYYLQGYYLLKKPGVVYGFTKNILKTNNFCNIADNAKNHVGKKHLLNIDLEDFFPSIPAERIKNLFISEHFNFNDHISTVLTLLCTYNDELPIGTPTSPVLSNFICLELDDELKKYCSINNIAYSRYADDLTFSSNDRITQDNTSQIIKIINKHKFNINIKKLHSQSSNRRQTVTGLTVNSKVNVNRKLLKQVRAMIYDLSINGLDLSAKKHFNTKGKLNPELKVKFLYKLDGYINFIGQIRGNEDSLYLKFKKEFNNILTN
jgi:RNA-directed DNA polymerase